VHAAATRWSGRGTEVMLALSQPMSTSGADEAVVQHRVQCQAASRRDLALGSMSQRRAILDDFARGKSFAALREVKVNLLALPVAEECASLDCHWTGRPKRTRLLSRQRSVVCRREAARPLRMAPGGLGVCAVAGDASYHEDWRGRR
jgi:hypothetical protein